MKQSSQRALLARQSAVVSARCFNFQQSYFFVNGAQGKSGRVSSGNLDSGSTSPAYFLEQKCSFDLMK